MSIREFQNWEMILVFVLGLFAGALLGRWSVG